MSISLGSVQGFPLTNSPVVDRRGIITQPWLQFMIALWSRTGQSQGIIPSGEQTNDGLTFLLDDDQPAVPDQLSQFLPEGDEYVVQSAFEPPDPTDPVPDNSIGLAALQEDPQPIRGAPLDAPAVGASPFSYVSPRRQAVLVSGGTVTLIEYSRDGTTFYATGLVAGMFVLETGDILRVTYAVAPAVFITAPF